MKMSIIKINDHISYIEASDNPLSADIGIIKDGDKTWLYDVGNGEQSLSSIPECKCNVVLSHFHADHIGNIDNVNCDELYVSKETYKHVGKGTIIDSDTYIGNIHIFPIPSSHAKGCLGLEVDDSYAFLGDALYSKVKDGYYIYNSQLVKAEIEVLEHLKSQYMLVSHYPRLLRKKEDVLAELRDIYSNRDKNSSEILVPINKR